MVIGITQKKLEELKPVEAMCVKVAKLEEEVKALAGDAGETGETDEEKKKEVMEAVQAKKRALAALRQEKSETTRSVDASIKQLQRELFQLRGKVVTLALSHAKMMEVDEANARSQRVLETVSAFQQRSQTLQQELAQQKALLAELQAKQQAVMEARPSEALLALQGQLAAAETELVVAVNACEL